jgi:hypothetical protein
MSIGGALSLAQPGDTGRLTATATFSDQTSRDVTAEATWLASVGIVAITGPGSVTAVRYGQENIVASYKTVGTTAPIRVVPPGAFLVNGRVRSEVDTPLAHAQVEASSRCGTMSTETDARGWFWLPAVGDTIMRISMENYAPETLELVVEADRQMEIALEAIDLPDSVSGDYTLTVTPSPSCLFPSDLFPRKYAARVRDVSGSLRVVLSGAEFIAWGDAGFTGTRDGSTVRFVVSDSFGLPNDDDYTFIEFLPPGVELHYRGTAMGEVHDEQISAAFSGTIEGIDYSSRTSTFPACTATDHRFELVPATRK